MAHEPQSGGTVDLILQQIRSLPTLSPVAVRMIRIAESGDADLRQIASLISSDPAVAVKVLALCRRADMGVARSITTIDRAVVMLGLDAVRAALLSVEVHEAFACTAEQAPASDAAQEPRAFERRELWRHSLAVACAAECIAESDPRAMAGFTPQEAFLAGLLHDLGKLALDALLPRSYQRIATLARERRLSIAEVERKILGIDHHGAGKRLAEHWGLPHALQDVMWLHAQPGQALPQVRHRPLIAAVTIADAVVRSLHLGWSGNHAPIGPLPELCASFGIDPRACAAVNESLHERVAQRCADLGLDDATSQSLLVESLGRASGQLGHVNALLDRRIRDIEKHTRALEAVRAFLANADRRAGLSDAVADILASAREQISPAYAAVILRHRAGADWTLHRDDTATRAVSCVTLPPPPEGASVASLIEAAPTVTAQAPLLGWLEAHARGPAHPGSLRLVPLASSEEGLTALLLHDAPADAAVPQALSAAWGAAVIAASRHDGARRLAEMLADANRSLADAQAKLVEQRSMIRLGEVAAGAAHEMNNPLTVISGMAQMLADGLKDPDKRTAASAIVAASEKLSELITSLHLFADPPRPKRAAVDVAEILRQSLRIARQRWSASPRARGAEARASVVCDAAMPPARLDAQQITLALTELVLNALQSGPRRLVEVRAHIDPFDDRLIISVTDDGAGMSSHALEHAFDPFFSELASGRRTGLGLTRARRFVDLHAGELTLESAPGKGTVARITLPDWRAAHTAVSEAA